MCGIAGIIEPSRPDAARRVEEMLQLMVHRGPDDRGFETLPTPEAMVALGARRLAIQDLSDAGHQPMREPGGDTTVALNGEIYNAPDLRSELQRHGWSFKGHSDTEVVLAGFIAWGEGVFTRLSGMFAIAVWDPRTMELVLVRDPTGIKPLYYTSGSGAFAFASEVRALAGAGIAVGGINREALRDYLAYGAVQEPATIYEFVRALEPGEIVRVTTDGRLTRSDRLSVLPGLRTTTSAVTDAAAEGRDLIEGVVEQHLISDVPVGMFLSSGLDSSIIFRLAAKSGADVTPFTVTFPDQQHLSEGEIARQVANAAGAELVECPVSAEQALAWAKESLRVSDQPAADGLNTFIISRVVHEQGFKVALAGHGGDELFGGYRSFRGVPRAQRILRMVRPLNPSRLAQLLRVGARNKAAISLDKLSDMLSVGDDLVGLFLQTRRVFSDDWLTKAGFERPDPSERSRRLVVPGDPVTTIARLEFDTYLRNTLLRDADVFAMANSVEVRVPLVDHRVARWALSLPGDVVLPPQAPPKHLLRKMFKHLLIADQLTQPKRGFALPLGPWLHGPLRPILDQALDHLETDGVIAPPAIARFRDIARSGASQQVGFRGWTLIALSRWLQRG